MTDEPADDDVRHIRQTHVDRQHLSWCKVELEGEWAFTGIDHAVNTRVHGDFILPCSRCVAMVIFHLRWNPDAKPSAGGFIDWAGGPPEVTALARFGAAVLLQYHDDGERGDIDGDALQQMAVQAGAIVPEPRTTPCGEHCPCAEFHGSGERTTCYPIANFDLVRRLAQWRPSAPPAVDGASRTEED